MTRAVVFLAAAMVAASLGGMAQDSPGRSQDSTQNNADNSTQHSVTVAANPQQNTGSGPSAVAPNTRDATKSTAARDSSDPKGAGSEVNADTNNGQLPQTSTILPLLGLIGLGSLVAGFFARH